jgi:N-acetylglucosaminyldiphosphoundecaprenol N-acetyl-beta-D-mannosaminyltransferase
MNDTPSTIGIADRIFPDFSRNVYCVLGLTVDAVSFAEAKDKVLSAIKDRRRLLLTTPNMNFVTISFSSPKFRNSILCSDLCTADGMPLVWISRILGAPLDERVSGSNLFSTFIEDTGTKLRVFLFGGEEGTAQAAAERLNGMDRGVNCVGHFYPGFTPVEEMATPEVLKVVNDSNADFLLLALGAQKGQSWIMDTERRLNVPVISHLGSTLNYIAGTVRRAPAQWQRLGLEWLWRVKEEPYLWRRYFKDFIMLIKLLLSRVIPSVAYRFLYSPTEADLKLAALSVCTDDNTQALGFKGPWDKRNLSLVRLALQEAFQSNSDIVLDFEQLSYADSAFLGLILLAYGYQHRARRRFSISRLGSQMPTILYLYGCEYLKDAVDRN